MLQDDSNGESSFEIIDKKGQLTVSTEKPESVSTSSVFSAYSIPSPSLVGQPNQGNLLSNVAPPSSIPDFTLWSSPHSSGTAANVSPITSQNMPTQMQVRSQPVLTPAVNQLASEQQFPSTQFSAAIPPSKGIPLGPIEQSHVNQNESTSGGLIGLFKEAFSSGGVLSKVAEKAKNSVDSIITTLDPQMNSGGDTEVTVISENEEEVCALREAFHCVFGKAWVNGMKLNQPTKKSWTIGFEAGITEAQEKIAYSLKYRNTPTVAIEDVLLQQGDNWYGLSLLVLKDAEKRIEVQTFSQATPLPVQSIMKQIDGATTDSASLSCEERLVTYLQLNPDWQLNVSGVSRKEVLVLAGKVLVKVYKNQLISK